MISFRSAAPKDRSDGKRPYCRIRALEEKDLESVLSIERVSFPSPWSRKLFEQELGNPISRCWAAEFLDVDGLVGYLCVWLLPHEMHVMNLATHPLHRGVGVARKLIVHALEEASEFGLEQVVLEVRESNRAAQHLYRSLGFRVIGMRKGYYQDTGDDALVMVRDLL